MTALKCKRLPHITLPAVHTYTYLLVADIFTLPVKSAVFILTIYGKNVHFYYRAVLARIAAMNRHWMGCGSAVAQRAFP